ncbi:HlyD family efflux transporter periplasmic adaptor subunit [Candidatus Pacebacteria bacterium]|nr:HlyD family efflux transporter periplasmic adaptor subunit [Candidatus Paceibacterota bacterium]
MFPQQNTKELLYLIVMRIILHSSSFYILGAVALIGLALYLLLSVLGTDTTERITAVAERGDITETVSVSGVVEAKNTAELAFPTTGIVTEVFIDEGVEVAAGDVLITLASAVLVAERLDAVAALQKALVNRDELLAGPTTEARSVTSQQILNAEENLALTIAVENEKVKNTQRTLLSSSLEAYSINRDENAAAPNVTGTYTCAEEGSYVLDVYNSGTVSGYSYNLKGLESGSYSAFVDSPGIFGSCGLFLQFDNTSQYSNSNWIIEIPNIRSAPYQTNLNAYNLALQQQQNAVEAAKLALILVQEEASVSNASPRSEAVARANAEILQAQARINSIDAQMKDRSIIAPFDGVVTDVSILPGETASTLPVITLLAADAFDLTVRIPEIDITKIIRGQKTSVVFDAQRDETIEASVDFISPLATEIDGVAYFEAAINFGDTPKWIRSGLNADIEIEVAKVEDVIKIPKRFLIIDDDSSTVLILENENINSKEVTVGFSGNDGFVEIIGLNEGTIVVAP